jgi:uncharacterized protein (TIGR02677 family)
MASDTERWLEEQETSSAAAALAEAAGRVLSHADKLRLESLRYAIRPEAETYVAIMRTFTGGISGLLSDQSAAEVRQRLMDEHGIELDLDTIDIRLSQLVELGNLARSPRESEARSIKEYLQHRARYQLTQRGGVVHRMVEELLQHAETAREVSSEMLGGILESVRELNRIPPGTLADIGPDELARRITTLFAQFERLVESTRDFYTYLSEVLRRFDLSPDEFKAYKNLLIDYLHRFVEEIGMHMPQIGDELTFVWPNRVALVDRANAGQRLVGLDGARARRDRGLAIDDWPSLAAWFLGEPGREADAVQVRRLATEAMNALLSNLRRIVAGGAGERSRHRDLITLARWFARADDATAHALWVAAFGLYPDRRAHGTMLHAVRAAGRLRPRLRGHQRAAVGGLRDGAEVGDLRGAAVADRTGDRAIQAPVGRASATCGGDVVSMGEVPDWLADAALEPVWHRVAEALEQRGLTPTGQVVVAGLDRASRHAVAGMLGRRVLTDRARIDLGELDRFLRERSGLGGLRDVVEAVRGEPLVDRAALRSARSASREAPFAAARDWLAAHPEPALPWADEWLAGLRRTGYLSRRHDPARLVQHALKILADRFDGDGTAQVLSRVELAARTCADAHALDDGTPLAHLVLRGLATAFGAEPPGSAAERRALWERVR